MRRPLVYMLVAVVVVATGLMLRNGHRRTSGSSSAAPAPSAQHGSASIDDDAADDADDDRFPPSSPTKAATDTRGRDATRPLVVTVVSLGVPRADANVVIEFGGRRGQRLFETSDSNGMVRADIPARTDELIVSASMGRFAAVSWETNGMARSIEPLAVTLALDEQGVIITAEIHAEQPFPQGPLLAKIVSKTDANERWLRATVTTNCTGNLIVFPAIKIGLSNLVVMVRTQDSVTCYSEPFDTLDGRDKTVVVEVPETLVMSGRALLDDGTPARKFSLVAKPVNKQQGEFKTGVFRDTIETDELGNYEASPLIPAVYVLKADCAGCYTLYTNVWFVDSSVPVDLVFTKIKCVTMNGIVMRADTEQPASGASVTLQTWLDRSRKQTFETTGDGKFTFQVPVNNDGAIGTVKAEKSGFAPAVAFLAQNYRGEDVVLWLRQAGAIAGAVRDETQKLLAGVDVVARPDYRLRSNTASTEPPSERAFFPPEGPASTITYFLRYQSAPSGLDGRYMISNVAAPEVYLMDVTSAQYFVARPPGTSLPTAKVEPFQTAWCDLTVREMSLIYIRAVDAEEQPILNYTLRVELAGGGTRERFEERVKLSRDEWYLPRLKQHGLFADTVVSVQAVSDNLVSEKVSGIFLCGEPTNMVQLLLEPQDPVVSGLVLMPDDTPAAGAVIEATATKTFTHARATSDEAGYFEVFGLETEQENERIALRVRAKWGEYADATTNVPAHTKNIIIRLTPMFTLMGKVHYEVIGNPATNFTVRIGTGNTRRTFYPDDGTFTWYFPGALQMRKGSLFTTAPGYAPVETPFEFGATSNVCDVGDVVLGAQDCSLKGKVLNQDRRPLAADVVVRKETEEGIRWQLSTRSSAADGTFSFSGLPVCDVKVFARTAVGVAESERLTLKPDDTLFVPDLVIFTTNAQEVTFLISMADGTRPPKLYFEQFRIFSDESGMMTAWLKPGTYPRLKAYAAWKTTSDGRIDPNRTGAMIYYADSFEIAADTRSVRLTLRAGDHLTGFATINGRPVNDTLVFENIAKQVRLSVVVADGRFALDGPEGRYMVSYTKRHTAAAVNLVMNTETPVALATGNAMVTAQFPWRGTWSLDARLNIGGYWTSVASVRQGDVSTATLAELLPGEYRFYASGRRDAVATNGMQRVILQQNERKLIKF